MPQLAKTRRTGWAVLAAAALFASLFAVGASPAGAVTGEAEAARSFNAACTGAAAEGNSFADVSDAHTHNAAISCLVHYGITTGSGDGSTYDPQGTVTRWQMALFMQRAAGKTGTDLGAVTDQGFGDIGGLAQNIQDAINQVAGAGVMSGNSATAFGPGVTVDRGEMARIIVDFLAANSAVSGVSVAADGTISVCSGCVDNDGTDQDGSDESFADVTATQPVHIDRAVRALAELGIAQGTGDGTSFSADAAVSRGQMAAFITRALAFTSAKPAGLSITPTGTVMDGNTIYDITYLDANHAPIRNARIDAFYSLSDGTDAFTAEGTCSADVVFQLDENKDSESECSIDGLDQVTNGSGQLRVSVPATVNTERGVSLFVWTGTEDTILGSSVSPRHHYDPPADPPAENVTGSEISVTFTSGDTELAPIGESNNQPVMEDLMFSEVITVTVQVTDDTGTSAAEEDRVYDAEVRYIDTKGTGPNGDDTEEAMAFRLVTDDSGSASFSFGGVMALLGGRAPTDNEPNLEIDVVIVENPVDSEGNDDSTGNQTTMWGLGDQYDTATAESEETTSFRYSTEASVVTNLTASRDGGYLRASAENDGVSDSLSVLVTDQYNNPMGSVPVTVSATANANGVETLSVALYTGSDGMVTISYRRASDTSALVTMAAEYDPDPDTNSDEVTGTVNVLWVTENVSATGSEETVEAGDPSQNEAVVDTDSGYEVVTWDSNDRYNIVDETDEDNTNDAAPGLPATQAEFEAALTAALMANADESGSVTIQLSWVNFNSSNSSAVSTWTLLLS